MLCEEADGHVPWRRLGDCRPSFIGQFGYNAEERRFIYAMLGRTPPN